MAAALVEQAISGLDALGTDKDSVEWEVMPFVAPDSSVRWLVGIGLPVPVTGDTEMPFAVLDDPHDREGVARVVRALYAKAAGDAALKASRARAGSNGHNESPGGLVLP